MGPGAEISVVEIPVTEISGAEISGAEISGAEMVVKARRMRSDIPAVAVGAGSAA
ncbi:hypothetical protein [Frankia sp. CiP1_Cm_nod2]|uniref:hypothetical protein n=1 Tax=Frankia sp. CiP1_Cm_nod2 TaxID=2897161 RepID=UPI0020241AE0